MMILLQTSVEERLWSKNADAFVQQVTVGNWKLRFPFQYWRGIMIYIDGTSNSSEHILKKSIAVTGYLRNIDSAYRPVLLCNLLHASLIKLCGCYLSISSKAWSKLS